MVVEDGWWVVALDGTDRGNKRAGAVLVVVVLKGTGSGGGGWLVGGCTQRYGSW